MSSWYHRLQGRDTSIPKGKNLAKKSTHQYAKISDSESTTPHFAPTGDIEDVPVG